MRNFRNTCLEIYEFDSVYFLNAQGLAWQAASKKDQGRIRSVTDIHILLMVEKNIRGRICHATHWYALVNNNWMKEHDKYKESLYFKYWDVNNLYGWAMLQNLPVDGFK